MVDFKKLLQRTRTQRRAEDNWDEWADVVAREAQGEPRAYEGTRAWWSR